MISVAQRSNVTQIDVSEYVKDELDRIMGEEEHKTYDSVVRVLVGNYEQ